MSEPIFGTIKVDEIGVVEDWRPTVNLRWKPPIRNHIPLLQQLWYDTKSDKQEWRNVPEISE